MSETCPKCGSDPVPQANPQKWKCGTVESEEMVGKYYPSIVCDLRNQLTAAQADRDQYKEWWEQSCQHVKEALELLGVDVSVDGYVPDTWTLREQCAAAQSRIAELEAANERRAESAKEIIQYGMQKIKEANQDD